MSQKEIASNRRATFDYEILERFEAGIALQGTEVKSLRSGGASLQESYIRVMDNEVLLLGANIAPYRFGNIYNHEEKRPRKLLLHKKEMAKLRTFASEKGLTLIPLSLYWKNGHVKVQIGCCRGKKLHDKRAAIKERDERRDIAKEMKRRY